MLDQNIVLKGVNYFQKSAILGISLGSECPSDMMP